MFQFSIGDARPGSGLDSHKASLLVSILYWRCPVHLYAAQVAAGSSFNSLLEMRWVYTSTSPTYMTTVSILYWRCPFTRQGQDRWSAATVSILYWRCHGHVEVKLARQVDSFNSLLEMRLARRAQQRLAVEHAQGFNSLLEMRPCMSLVRGFSALPYAVSILYWRCR